jgi:hypothetical protein
MTKNTQTTVSATKNVAKNKDAIKLVAPDAVVNPFAAALAQVAARGAKTANAAAKAVDKAVHVKAVDNIAPIGVATRNAGQATTIPGFALVGVNGRKQPLASSVTAQIWLAAMAHQMGNNGAMPTQATIKLACPTVNPTSCGLGLTQYKAYTGQVKGSAALTVEQIQALAVVKEVAAK